MLNYIWGGLIIFSLLFALVNDGNDIFQNTWRNGEVIQIEASFPVNADLGRNQDIRFTIPGDTTRFEARWHPVDDQAELIIPVTNSLPEHWQRVAQNQESSRQHELRAHVEMFETRASANSSSRADTIRDIETNDPEITGTEILTTAPITMAMEIILPEVHFVKLRAITSAAFEMAEFGVTLALGLIGIMALWLGLMKIAEESGLIHLVVKGVRPVMGWLFPELPKDHPAMGMISLNLAANILGLGNAATPLGIKAMEELQKLNPDKESATNSMCMFLALNTSSVQLLPPVTLVAIMGLRVNELMIAITITTIFSTAMAIMVAKWYARRNPPPVLAGVTTSNGPDPGQNQQEAN